MLKAKLGVFIGEQGTTGGESLWKWTVFKIENHCFTLSAINCVAARLFSP